MTARKRKTRSASLEINQSVVHVKWIDSTSWSGWQYHDDIERFAKENQALIDTVGIAIGDTEENLTIAHSISESCKHSSMKIPKVAIKSINVIGKIGN